MSLLRGPSWPFVDKKVLPLPFFAALRGQKGVASCRGFAALRGQKGVAVAVLRGPSRPFVEKGVAASPFFAALRRPTSFRQKGPCRCRSSRPFAGPSWTKRCCRCRSGRGPSWPLAVRNKGVAVAVLSGPSWPLRGQKGVAVAVHSRPNRGRFVDKRKLQLPFFAALRWTKGCCRLPLLRGTLRGPSWTKGSCSCRSSQGPFKCPFVDKRCHDRCRS